MFVSFLRVFLGISFSLLYTGIASASNKSNISDICQLIKKVSHDNSNVEYVAGIDVHGSKILPADLNSDDNNFVEFPIIIPIQIDLIEHFGLNLPSEVNLEPLIGNIKIYSNGNVQYKNNDISENIQKLCIDQEKSENNVSLEHRQRTSDPVRSTDKIEGQYPEEEHQSSSRYNE